MPVPPPGPRIANPTADGELRQRLIDEQVIRPHGVDVRDELLAEQLRDRPTLRLDDEGRKAAAISLAQSGGTQRPQHSRGD
jgi:hypothetical protein